MNKLEKKVSDMYKKAINEDHCKICYQVDKTQPEGYKRCYPQSMWHIGKNLIRPDKKIRLTFVGKTSWNTKTGIRYDDRIQKEPTQIVNCFYMGKNWFNDPENYQYWQYIIDITTELELGLEDIAISNLVKCNIYKTRKNTSENLTDYEYFQNCIKIFEKEMNIIKPTHIVFFTNNGYDDLINSLRFWFNDSYWYYIDVKDISYYRLLTRRKDIKKENRRVCWWHREFYDDCKRDRIKLHILRTRHPQGAPRELKEKIIEWVNNNSQD